MTREDHEEADFLAFVADNTKEHGQEKPRRIGNPPLSFKEYWREHDGCWIC